MNTQHRNRIEAIYPLAPTQEGMLFHALYAPGSTVYVVQVACRLEGNLNVGAFERAWQRLTDENPVLRTAFAWEGVDRPLQVVGRRGVSLKVKREDWRGLAREQQQSRVNAFLPKDRRRGFRLTKAPLMRLLLVQLEDDVFQFVWTYHHLILDGWSMAILLKDFFSYYQAFTHGLDVQPRPSSPFVDYITWLKKQDMSEAEEYWRTTLAGLVSPTATGLDHVSNGAPEKLGAQEHVIGNLSSELTSSLQTLASRNRMTLNTLVKGAWSLLLNRYSGDESVVFGATVSGRPVDLPGADTMIGMFINTLPVRVDVPPDAKLVPWLKRIQRAQAELHQFEYSPLVRIQKWSEFPRDMPLFESIVVFENYPVDSTLGRQLGDVEMDDFRFVAETNFPLTVIAEPGHELSLQFSYDSDRYDRKAIRRMQNHFQIVLEGMVSKPSAALADIPLLTPTECDQQLVEWNTRSSEEPPQTCVHHVIEAQAARTPEQVAAACGGCELSYRELNQRANRLAHYLQSLKVTPEALVGICMPRSLEMVVSVLAVLKAGAAYVPIDPGYPKARVKDMLDDARLKFLLTEQGLLSSLPEHEASFICVDTDWPQIETHCDANPVTSVSAVNRIYAIFTSGSTGRPKVAVVYHGGFSNLMQWFIDDFAIAEHDRDLMVSSFNFDLTQKNLFAPLMTGGRLELLDTELFDPAAVRELISSRRITLLNCTPSTFYPLVEHGGEEVFRQMESLRYVFLGGEPISLRRVRDWTSSPLCRAEIVNTYGPTECTDVCAFYRIRDPERLQDQSVPIGHPIPRAALYVLDGQLRLLPAGATGELCVAGAGVGQGYINDQALTSQKFVLDTFSPHPGDRLYRTGDLVRYRPDGEIEYIGRMDHQVKLRGFRVELGEIETLLGARTDIKEAVALVREDDPGMPRLVAYLVSRNGQNPDASDLRQELRSKLPAYMVPGHFVFLDKLPLSPNGKVDRKALPVPAGSDAVSARSYVPPRTSQETALTEILAEVLGVARVGIDDNFFELGGDSILAILTISKAIQVGLRLTPQQLFQSQTIGELASVARALTAVEAEQDEVIGPVSLTPVQRHFFRDYDVDLHHFNQTVLLEVREELDVGLLESALDILLRHHDALRMRFERAGAGWQARNAGTDASSMGGVFTEVDLSGMSASEQREHIERSADLMQASLDLTNGPLMRAAYYKLGTEKSNRLLLVIHHLVMDGVSWRILLNDLLVCYQQLTRGATPRLPPKSTSVRQWSHLLVEYAKSNALEAEIDYWLRAAGRRVATLPVDTSGGTNTVASRAMITRVLTVDETRSLLQDVPAAFRTQINDTLLAALVAAFCGFTGEQSLLLELEGHGREQLFDDVDITRTIGWFTTLYPVRLEIPGTDSPVEALKAVQHQLQQIPMQGIGYGLIRYLRGDASVAEKLAAQPHPQVVFNYLGQFDQELPGSVPIGLASENSGMNQSPRHQRLHLFDVVGGVSGRTLKISWGYSRNLHHAETVERLADRYMDELRKVIDASRTREAVDYKPDDFPLAKLNQRQLDKVLSRVRTAKSRI